MKPNIFNLMLLAISECTIQSKNNITKDNRPLIKRDSKRYAEIPDDVHCKNCFWIGETDLDKIITKSIIEHHDKLDEELMSYPGAFVIAPSIDKNLNLIPLWYTRNEFDYKYECKENHICHIKFIYTDILNVKLFKVLDQPLSKSNEKINEWEKKYLGNVLIVTNTFRGKINRIYYSKHANLNIVGDFTLGAWNNKMEYSTYKGNPTTYQVNVESPTGVKFPAAVFSYVDYY